VELPPELQIIHEPVRLRIMSLLYRQNDVGFAALRERLDITPGNLASHAQKLVSSGLLDSRNALTRSGFEKRFQITAVGIQRFEEYLQSIETFLRTARETATNPVLAEVPATAPKPAGRSGAVTGTLIAGLFFVLSEITVQLLSDTSGSTYFGIGATGLFIAAAGPLRHFYRR
jgi:DNA-binding MarR family transcriptional regulator